MLALLSRKLIVPGAILAAVVALFIGVTAYIGNKVDDAYDQGAQDVRDQIVIQNTQEYKNVRRKADSVPRPRDVDDARSMLRDYLNK